MTNTSSPKPIDAAFSFYSEQELAGIMLFCARHGVVVCDEDVFLCAYPTHSSILNGTKQEKDIDKPDTWHVVFGAGTLECLMECAEPLEFVSWRRNNNRLRICKWSKLWETQYHSFQQSPEELEPLLELKR